MPEFDLTKITMPFGTLRRKIRNALQAHDDAGGKIDVWTGAAWIAASPAWEPTHVYRVKPQKFRAIDQKDRDPCAPVPLLGNGTMRFYDNPMAISDDATIGQCLTGKPITQRQVGAIFAAVREWQEADVAELVCGPSEVKAAQLRLVSAKTALRNIKVPS